MNFKQIAPNQVEITNANAQVLISYETPVAAFITGRGYVRTAKKWSATTTKHINKWLIEKGADVLKVERVEQDELIKLLQ